MADLVTPGITGGVYINRIPSRAQITLPLLQHFCLCRSVWSRDNLPHRKPACRHSHHKAKSNSSKERKRCRFFFKNHPSVLFSFKNSLAHVRQSLLEQRRKFHTCSFEERRILHKCVDVVVLWQLFSHNSFYNCWKNLNAISPLCGHMLS